LKFSTCRKLNPTRSGNGLPPAFSRRSSRTLRLWADKPQDSHFRVHGLRRASRRFSSPPSIYGTVIPPMSVQPSSCSEQQISIGPRSVPRPHIPRRCAPIPPPPPYSSFRLPAHIAASLLRRSSPSVCFHSSRPHRKVTVKHLLVCPLIFEDITQYNLNTSADGSQAYYGRMISSRRKSVRWDQQRTIGVSRKNKITKSKTH
jgi:hypothetical protein